MPYKDRDRQREAQRKSARKRRAEQPETVRAQRRESRSRARQRNLAIVAAFKASGCSRCDEDNPVALDCHHVGEKRFAIGKRAAWDCSESELREELSRCIVLCANCHRKEHAKR